MHIALNAIKYNSSYIVKYKNVYLSEWKKRKIFFISLATLVGKYCATYQIKLEKKKKKKKLFNHSIWLSLHACIYYYFWMPIVDLFLTFCFVK